MNVDPYLLVSVHIINTALHFTLLKNAPPFSGCVVLLYLNYSPLSHLIPTRRKQI